MQTRRNDPCPCGSGKKYKNCCAVKHTRSAWVATISVSVFVIVAAMVLAGVLKDARGERKLPPGYVWNEEHGHPHRISGEEPLPSELPPAGSEWVDEHNHYHGPDGRAISWSDAQQVWLDADGNPLP